MTESGYTASLRKPLLAVGVYPLKLSLPYTAGVADSWYDGDKGDVWVEWKYYRSLPRVIDLTAGKKPKLSVLQQDWLKARHLRGRNVAVGVASPKGTLILRYPEYLAPITRDEFLARAVDKEQVVHWIASQVLAPESLSAAFPANK